MWMEGIDLGSIVTGDLSVTYYYYHYYIIIIIIFLILKVDSWIYQ